MPIIISVTLAIFYVAITLNVGNWLDKYQFIQYHSEVVLCSSADPDMTDQLVHVFKGQLTYMHM